LSSSSSIRCHVGIHVHIHIDVHAHSHIHRRPRIHLNTLLYLDFRALVVATLIEMVSMTIFHFLRRFQPLFSVSDRAIIFRFLITVLHSFLSQLKRDRTPVYAAAGLVSSVEIKQIETDGTIFFVINPRAVSGRRQVFNDPSSLTQ
jgi:hypothetical protein